MISLLYKTNNPVQNKEYDDQSFINSKVRKKGDLSLPLKLHSEQLDTKGSFHVHKDTKRKGPNRECKCFLYCYNNILHVGLENNHYKLRCATNSRDDICVWFNKDDSWYLKG
jgi:hypothetical protein